MGLASRCLVLRDYLGSYFKALGQQGQDVGVEVIDACAQLLQFGRRW